MGNSKMRISQTTRWEAEGIRERIYEPPGSFYRSTEKLRVIYGADEVWCVLAGTLVINNPQTGEVHMVKKGDAVFFRKDTWHHGFNYGKEPLRVLEFFAPPPAAGTTGAYSDSKPYLKKFKEGQDEWIGRWPMSRSDVQRSFTMQLMEDSNLLWRFEGQALVGFTPPPSISLPAN